MDSQRHAKTVARFWKYVTTTDTECWGWTGSTYGPGLYGRLWDGERIIAAHRFSYQIHHGEIPPGFQVMHSCDNPPCTNPLHLRLGTALDNAQDRDRKGRQPSGDQHWKRRFAGDSRFHYPNWIVRDKSRITLKLTDKKVLEIKALARQGVSQVKLSKQFGVGQATISGILRGHTWKHVR